MHEPVCMRGMVKWCWSWMETLISSPTPLKTRNPFLAAQNIVKLSPKHTCQHFIMYNLLSLFAFQQLSLPWSFLIFRVDHHTLCLLYFLGSEKLLHVITPQLIRAADISENPNCPLDQQYATWFWLYYGKSSILCVNKMYEYNRQEIKNVKPSVRY